MADGYDLCATDFDGSEDRGILRGFSLVLKASDREMRSVIHTTGTFWTNDTWPPVPPEIASMINTPIEPK
jgi:hypothetical protein